MNTLSQCLPPPRLLVVDNDLEIRSLLEVIFDREGFDVLVADNGQEALDLLDKIKVPELILSDMSMPIMGGAEFFQRLQSQEKTKRIPVILSSALDNIEAESRRLGASGYIKKPFTLEGVINFVKKHMDPT